MAKITWRGDLVAKKIEDALLDGAEEWLTVDVKTDSVNRTPWREGILAGSHTVKRGSREVVLGVGGPAAPYAEVQHEDATLHHDDGEDHFLEKAFNDSLDMLPSALEKRLESFL